MFEIAICIILSSAYFMAWFPRHMLERIMEKYDMPESIHAAYQLIAVGYLAAFVFTVSAWIMLLLREDLI